MQVKIVLHVLAAASVALAAAITVVLLFANRTKRSGNNDDRYRYATLHRMSATFMVCFNVVLLATAIAAESLLKNVPHGLLGAHLACASLFFVLTLFLRFRFAGDCPECYRTVRQAQHRRLGWLWACSGYGISLTGMLLIRSIA